MNYIFDEKQNTPLCEIMGRNKSDKGHINITQSWHNYTTFYYSIFKNIKYEQLRIFELGLGTNNTSIDSNMGQAGRPGASLYGWAEFFSNAQIFGADIDTDILFNTEKINTFYCDQTKPDIIKKLWEEPKLQDNFDIIIEDGLHKFDANVTFFENSIHKLKPNGYYIIEDIMNTEEHLFINKINEWKIKYEDCDFTLLKIPSLLNHYDNTLLVVFKKPNFNNNRSVLFVSAFQDLGRTNWLHYKRATSDYVSVFGNIAKHNLNLICFCEDDIAQELKNKFNFHNSFPYNKFDSYYCFLEKETEIMNSDHFNALIKHRKHHPECFCPEYNIVNHNKIIFIQKAKIMFPNYSHYIWIDFAYGSFKYDNYVFKGVDLSKLSDKIKYRSFIRPNTKTYNPINNCMFPLDTIHGSMFTIPNHLVEWYINEYTRALQDFHSINIVDDDQAIVLYIYHNNPDKFDLYISNDFHGLIRTIEND